MEFNVPKCKLMHFGSHNKCFDYYTHGQQLQVVSSEKDLGVIITDNLKVADNCNAAYTRANQMLGLVSRSIRHRNVDILVRLYKSLVRPHLEYSAPVWNPHVKDKFLLEKVQQRFTRMFEELRCLDYHERLEALKLWSLEERRHRADLIEVFKMVHGLSAVSLSKFFNVARSTTRGHTWKLVKSHSNTDMLLHFFSYRVLNRWNSLPQEAVDSSSINAFKGHLDKLRTVKMGFFMDSWSA